MTSTLVRATALIEKHGHIAVFPKKTIRKGIPSLWECLHPRSKWSWDWTEEADSKVVRLWWLKDELARSKKVLYGRFFSGRPVFLSFNFARTHLIANRECTATSRRRLSALETTIYDSVLLDSPQSARQLRNGLKAMGVLHTRSEFNRALVGLQKAFLISNLGDSQHERGPMPSSEYGPLENHFPDLFFAD